MSARRIPFLRWWRSLGLFVGMAILLSFMFSPDRLLLFPTRGLIGATQRLIPWQGGEVNNHRQSRWP